MWKFSALRHHLLFCSFLSYKKNGFFSCFPNGALPKEVSTLFTTNIPLASQEVGMHSLWARYFLYWEDKEYPNHTCKIFV